MSGFDALQAGLAILSGQAGPGWRARVERVAHLQAEVVGAPPGLPVLPPRPPPRPNIRRPPPKAELERRARALFDGYTLRRFADIAGELAEEPWVIWADGALLRHPKGPLLEALAASRGKARPTPLRKMKSYTWPELRAALTRGLPEAFDALLGLRDGLMVTFEADLPPGPARIAMVFGPKPKQGFEARSLWIGAPDDAHVLSKRSLKADTPVLWAAEQLVRRAVLGHVHELEQLRSVCAEQMWFRDQRIRFEGLRDLLAAEPHRIGNAETVFMGGTKAPLSRIAQVTSQKVFDQIQKTSTDFFGRPFDRLNAEVVEVGLGLLDHRRGRAELKARAPCLMVRLEDEAGRPRTRVGGLFL